MDHINLNRIGTDDALEIGSTAMPWPKMNTAAFRGITGDLVRAATAMSEADPVAVLMSHLVYAGAMFGRTRNLWIGDDQHHGRLFCAIVGKSAMARKGTSLGPVMKVWNRAQEHLIGEPGQPKAPSQFPLGSKLKVARTLSSGEGVVYAIRDAGEAPGGEPDPGIQDKRLLVIETELANMFGHVNRGGNVLSAMMRQFWDGNDIAPLTKRDRISVTAPHVCLIGHITQDELIAIVDPVQFLNGLGSRILWAPVRRAQISAFPQPMPDSEVNRLAGELAGVMTAAHTVRGTHDLTLGNEAHEAWAHYYQELSMEHPGLLGAVAARGAPQVLRIAAIYCMLDGGSIITCDHLEAAMEVWRYCFQGATMIFGDRSANRDDDKVLDFLADGEKSQDAIRSGLFKGNFSSPEVLQILRRLESDRKIVSEKELKGGRGRPAIKWRLA